MSSQSKDNSSKNDRRIKRMLSRYGDLKPEECNDKERSHDGCEYIEMLHYSRNISVDEVDSNSSTNHNKPDFFSDTFKHRKLIVSNLIDNDDIKISPSCNFNRNGIWNWTGFKFLKNITNEKEEDDHRPIFTFWLILFHVIIFFYIISVYGISEFGIFPSNHSNIVWHQSNSYQPASYIEHPNVWLGPRPAILIRIGAKFTPCMRNENKITEHIEKMKRNDNESGCCVRLDNSGCAQTIKSKCSRKTSRWINSGTVCGLDPKYCSDPNSNWPKNVSQWPICQQNNLTAVLLKDHHMKCKILARPCCTGIYGQCMMASKEYCDFVKGTYHRKAFLCSQVNCLNDICGQMVNIGKNPNLLHILYRLFVSLFVHAGIFQLLLSVLAQIFYMRRLENVLGVYKITALYIFSGLGGNLGSLLFLPLTPEIGPNASLFGLLSFLLYETYNNWNNFNRPCLALFKVIFLFVILFALGLIFPWIDNFSSLFGLIYGYLIMFLIRPFKKNRRICSVICLFLLTCILIFLFYKSDLIESVLPYSKYFNCIPFNKKWCSSMDITYSEIKALN